LNIHDEPKIDCHVHVFDPVRFPYAEDAPYRPVGADLGTPAQLPQVLAAYGVRHALLVGPNSGYGPDSRCLLDTLSHDRDRYRGIAIVKNDVARDELAALKAAGVVGVFLGPAQHGVERYASIAPLLEHLVALDLFAQVQVREDQLAVLQPALLRSGAKVVIDHCGRPNPAAGLDQPGFRALLELAGNGRTYVKLSGHFRYSQQAYPYADTRPYVDALIEAFTLDACVWASDWPFLRPPERIDYGPLLKLVEMQLPDAADRRRLWWDTPRRLFGFGD
jgi:predicted TIM-barrel fold metal-dependent hydrolase